MVRILNLDACSHLYEQLIIIWQESFGDSKEYVQNFFEQNKKHTKVVLCEKESQVVSATYLLPVSYMQKDSTILRCFYLYAAATLPTFRGQGCFSQILRFVNEHINAPVILVPASMRLADYYKRHGFYIWLTENQEAIGQLENTKAKPITKEAYCEYRKEVLDKPGSVVWDDEMLDYICTEHEKAGGHFVETVIEDTRLLFMCIGNGDDWNVPEMLSYDGRFLVRPTVMTNKLFFEPENGYFNLTMG